MKNNALLGVLALFFWGLAPIGLAFSNSTSNDKEFIDKLDSPLSDKNIGVGFRMGLIFDPIVGSGLDAYYILNQKLQLGLYYAFGKNDFKDELTRDDEPNIVLHEASGSATVALVYGRFFFLRSLNFIGGIGRRTMTIKFDIEDIYQSQRIDTAVKSTSLIFYGGISNIWSWHNGFFIGADWLTLSIPFTSKTATLTSGNVTSREINEIQKDGEDLGKEIGKSIRYGLLILSIGFQI